MINAGTEVDAQTTIGHFDAIGGDIQRGVAANDVEDVEIFQNRLAFDGHVKDTRARCLPVKFGHFQGDVVGAVGNRQLVAESAPAPALVKSIFVRTHHRHRQTGEIAAHHKREVGLIDNCFRLIRHATGANGENNIVLWIGISQRLSVADTEIIQVDASPGEFHPQGRRTRVECDG